MDSKKIEEIENQYEFEVVPSTITPEEQVAIFNGVKGKDENGNSNCIVYYKHYSFEDLKIEEMNLMDEHKLVDRFKPGIDKTFNRANVELNMSEDFLQVDFTFESALSPDLRLFLNQLELFNKKRTAFCLAESNEMPQFDISLYPKVFNFTKYMVCVNPIYFFLQPERAGLQNFNTISILFSLDSVTFEMVDPMDEDELRELDGYIDRTANDAFLFENENN